MASDNISASGANLRRHAGWTPERVDLLKRRWVEGVSSSVIACELGVSRSAVIGKINRIGWGGLRRVATGKRKPKPCCVALRKPKTRDQFRAVESVVPKVGAKNLLILEIGPDQCRAPVGQVDGEYLFCGLPIKPGSSYCACHHAAFLVAAKKAPKAAKALPEEVA